MRLVVFNGPPRSGKDTAARMLLERWDGHGTCELFPLAREIKERTHALYGLGEINYRYFEDRKDRPAQEFYGLSPRRAYVEVATLLRGLHGRDFFGRLLLDRIQRNVSRPGKPMGCIVIPDAGTYEEVTTVYAWSGFGSGVVIQLERPGCVFDDGRESVTLRDAAHVRIVNDKGFSELGRQVIGAVRQ